MTVRRRLKRIGGSLGLIPKDFVEAIDVTDGTEALRIEPVLDTLGDDSVRRAFGAVLRRHSSAFEHLTT